MKPNLPVEERRPETRSDADVIRASRSDPEQFALIFDRHFDAIHRYLWCRVGKSLADDLAAETLCAAFASRSRFDPQQCDARPWLYGIATNLLRRYRRQEERQLRSYARLDPGRAELDIDAVIERADATTARRRVVLALAGLDARDRDVLLLYASAQLTYQGVADALKIPLGTVRSRLNRARRLMRRRLDMDRLDPAGDPEMQALRGEVCDGRA